MRRTPNQPSTEHFKTLTGERRIDVRTIRCPTSHKRRKSIQFHLIGVTRFGTEANEWQTSPPPTTIDLNVRPDPDDHSEPFPIVTGK